MSKIASAALGALSVSGLVPFVAAASAVFHARLMALRGGRQAIDLSDIFA